MPRTSFVVRRSCDQRHVHFGFSCYSLAAFYVVYGILICFAAQSYSFKGSEFGGDGLTDYQDSVVSDTQKVSGKSKNTHNETRTLDRYKNVLR